MRFMKLFRPIFLVLLFCIVPVTRADVFKPSVKEQIKLGEEAAAKIRKEFPVLPDTDPRVILLQQVAAKIVATFPKGEPWHFSFTVLQSKDVNAFALPGGPMFFFTGLLDKLQTQDELAGVIGHELTHVRRQHWAKMESDVLKRKIFITLGLILLHVNYFGTELADLANEMYTLQYSRGDEGQADEGGFKAMTKAGFNPQGMIDLFKMFEKMGSSGPEFASDHPSDNHRIQHIEDLIKDSGKTYPAQIPLNWPPALLAADKAAWAKVKK